jgi:copper chaperone CopZ
LGQVFRYGLVTLPADIAGSLLVGLVIAALLTALVPADALAPYLGGGLTAMLVAVVVGVPLYVCATGSIPIGLGLLAAGASPGAVLAFLIAGPATNAATVSVTWNLLGRRSGLLYLGSVLVTAIGSGLLLDAAFPTLASLGLPEAALHPHAMELGWWDHGLALAMLALLVPAVAGRWGWWPKSGGGPAEVRGSDMQGGEQAAERAGGGGAEQVLTVTGMTCSRCEEALHRELTAVPGVADARVDRRAKRATVRGVGVRREALVEAVEALGFGVEG